MGETIAVIPCIIVMVACFLGRKLLQGRLQVRDRARLKLDGRDAGGGTRIRDADDAVLDTGLLDNGGNLGCDVNHIAEALSGDLKRRAMHHRVN